MLIDGRWEECCSRCNAKIDKRTDPTLSALRGLVESMKNALALLEEHSYPGYVVHEKGFRDAIAAAEATMKEVEHGSD